jgi:hypothetical protein
MAFETQTIAGPDVPTYDPGELIHLFPRATDDSDVMVGDIAFCGYVLRRAPVTDPARRVRKCGACLEIEPTLEQPGYEVGERKAEGGEDRG